MQKKFFNEFTVIAAAILLSLSFFTMNVEAATTAVVAATVSAQNISVTVADATVTYGALGLGGSEDTTTSGLNDSQTATNNGNVTENFNIKGQNSANWTLAATAGSEQYVHEFCTSNCDSSPTWNALTTSYQTLGTGITTSGTSVFDLQITTPTSTASTAQQNVDVTVQAVAN